MAATATSPLDIEKDKSHQSQPIITDDEKLFNQEAQLGTEAEHSFGFVQAIKTYRRAAFWSMREFLSHCTCHKAPEEDKS